jgi:hypothetical protein
MAFEAEFLEQVQIEMPLIYAPGHGTVVVAADVSPGGELIRIATDAEGVAPSHAYAALSAFYGKQVSPIQSARLCLVAIFPADATPSWRWVQDPSERRRCEAATLELDAPLM